uniref:Uncharacterized protein n=1 Tax=Cucumis melo TaxID=3656 RepID=A0A9I9EI79_CUCME
MKLRGIGGKHLFPRVAMIYTYHQNKRQSSLDISIEHRISVWLAWNYKIINASQQQSKTSRVLGLGLLDIIHQIKIVLDRWIGPDMDQNNRPTCRPELQNVGLYPILEN